MAPPRSKNALSGQDYDNMERKQPEAGRGMHMDTQTRHAVETLIALILVPGVAVVLVPWLILSAAGDAWPGRWGPVELLAAAGAAVGLAMIVWVAWAFVRRGRGTPIPIDPPAEFVAAGLFRRVRNPMYVGALLVLLAEALFFRSGWLLAYAVALWAALHAFVVLVEEPQLARRFGDSYRAYCAAVPRWLPRP